MLLNPGDRIELKIVSLSSEGDGIGSYQGLTVFVSGALPLETVSAQISECKRNYARAHLEKVLVPSPHRITPPCPAFDRCGGCQIMHSDYPGQLKAKRQRVIDALERIGKFKDVQVEECLPSPQPLQYRNKIQLPATYDNGLITFGLYAKNSHQVVPVERCGIHCDLGESVLASVRLLIQHHQIVPYDETTGQGELRHLLIRTAVRNAESLVILITTGAAKEKFEKLANEIVATIPTVKGVLEHTNRRRDNVILSGAFTLLAGQPWITETICGLAFKVSPGSFFQVNPLQAEQLYEIAIGMAALTGNEKVLDAYCGVGTLALIASKHAKKVVGIESIAEAIDDARENAARNGVGNCRFVCGRTEHHLELMKDLDVVFLNPPRKGCEASVVEALGKAIPSKIVYVSCDPATLARDMALLRGKRILCR